MKQMLKQFKQAIKCFKPLIISSVSILFLVYAALGCDIILKKKVIVSSKNIEIREIALSYPKKLSKVVISPAPFVGNSITLTRNYISFTLKQKGIKASVCGPSTVTISTKSFLITKSLLSKVIGKNLTIKTHLPIFLPYSSNYSFKIKSISYSNKFVFYTIKVLKNSKPFKNITITAIRNSDGQLIPVAKKDIEVGQIITPSDICFKKVKFIPSNILYSKSSIVNRVAINFIPRGTPFSIANTRRFKPVKMGDIVNVEIISGNIKITTVAKALRGGYKGDIIPIMYLTSRKVVPAIIIGKKEVKVK